jgi:hypothetical protein
MKNEGLIRDAISFVQQALDKVLENNTASGSLTVQFYNTVAVLQWVLGDEDEGWLYPLGKAKRILAEAGETKGGALGEPTWNGQPCGRVAELDFS